MELLTYTVIWLAIIGLFAVFLLSNSTYLKAKKLADIALERIEVLKHKWIESEKAGCDIGMEKAQKSWAKNHAKKWKASRK
tara:strand:- start:776 stop:1018 length:243 start_codon:yes stop_codon:yes gene_type:complete